MKRQREYNHIKIYEDMVNDMLLRRWQASKAAGMIRYLMSESIALNDVIIELCIPFDGICERQNSPYELENQYSILSFICFNITANDLYKSFIARILPLLDHNAVPLSIIAHNEEGIGVDLATIILNSFTKLKLTNDPLFLQFKAKVKNHFSYDTQPIVYNALHFRIDDIPHFIQPLPEATATTILTCNDPQMHLPATIKLVTPEKKFSLSYIVNQQENQRY